MTLCTAVKVPCRALNPARQPLAFVEPGIVVAADTRFMWSGPVDDGIKVWPLKDFAVAAFSGDVPLGESAIYAMGVTLGEHTFRTPEQISRAMCEWLKYYSSRSRTPTSTEVLLAVYDDDRDRFELYRLKTDEQFDPQPREGVYAIGSGAKQFRLEFEKEVLRWAANMTRSLRSGYKLIATAEGKASVVPVTAEDRRPARLLDVSHS
jgi:20S proteasome alpha/beta subunit